MKLTLTIDSDYLTEKRIMAMAQVLKRIGFSDIRNLSENNDEAYDAQYVLEQIRKALAEQGYNPR